MKKASAILLIVTGAAQIAAGIIALIASLGEREY